MDDAFFDYAMLGAKGSKMPRGDKDQIMRYHLPKFSLKDEEKIGRMVVDIAAKLDLNRQINDNLPLPGRSSTTVGVRRAA